MWSWSCSLFACPVVSGQPAANEAIGVAVDTEYIQLSSLRGGGADLAGRGWDDDNVQTPSV